jgi:hypothetical protein
VRGLIFLENKKNCEFSAVGKRSEKAVLAKEVMVGMGMWKTLKRSAFPTITHPRRRRRANSFFGAESESVAV